MSNLQESNAQPTGNSNIVSLIPARRSWRGRITALAIVLAVGSLAAASALRTETAKTQSGTTPRASERPAASVEFVYFPAQYANQQASRAEGNQRQDPEEHAPNF